MIDAYLKEGTNLNDQTIHLLFSANRWEVVDSIRQDLLNGTTVIADRYAYSGVAFSYAKAILARQKGEPSSPGLGLGLGWDWCRAPDVGLLRPDLVLFLDLPIDDAEQRGGFGEERYEKRELQMAVRQIFHELAQGQEDWKMLDARKDLETLQLEIRQAVERLSCPGAFGTLW